MVLSPFILSNNSSVARFLLREKGPPGTATRREDGATGGIAEREHVILCGFGRVGQNVARVLESHGFEYIALDLDPARIRAARQAGDPVIFGDSADEEMLVAAGLDKATAVVISFATRPPPSASCIASARMRADVPVLVRTQDDAKLNELREAGATDVVPETFEASLMLVSQVLMLLKVPVVRVVRTIERDPQQPLRRAAQHREPRRGAAADRGRAERRRGDQDRGAAAGRLGVGRTLDEVRARGAEVTFTSIRRHGNRRPRAGRRNSAPRRRHRRDLRSPKALEHAESVLHRRQAAFDARPRLVKETPMHKSRLAGFIIDCQTRAISTPPPRSGRRRWAMS